MITERHIVASPITAPDHLMRLVRLEHLQRAKTTTGHEGRQTDYLNHAKCCLHAGWVSCPLVLSPETRPPVRTYHNMQIPVDERPLARFALAKAVMLSGAWSREERVGGG